MHACPGALPRVLCHSSCSSLNLSGEKASQQFEPVKREGWSAFVVSLLLLLLPFTNQGQHLDHGCHVRGGELENYLVKLLILLATQKIE